MGRKTVDVGQILAWANKRLASQTSKQREDLTPDQAFRLGVASLMEQILHATDNYKGFNYQASEFKLADEQADGDVLRDGYDDTRRFYYGPNGTRPGTDSGAST